MYPHKMTVTPLSLPDCDFCQGLPAPAVWLVKWNRWTDRIAEVQDVEQYVCSGHLVRAVQIATIEPDMPAVELVRL